MGVGSGKFSPRGGRGRSGIRKALALASCKMFKGARGVRSTPRDAAAARGVAAPITPQPASSIAPTGHFDLNCGFLYFELFVLARSKKGRGAGERNMGEAEVGKGGERFSSKNQL